MGKKRKKRDVVLSADVVRIVEGDVVLPRGVFSTLYYAAAVSAISDPEHLEYAIDTDIVPKVRVGIDRTLSAVHTAISAQGHDPMRWMGKAVEEMVFAYHVNLDTVAPPGGIEDEE